MGDICSFAKGKGYSKADVRETGAPLILYGRLYTKYQLHIEEVDTFADVREDSLFSNGNEVIVPASGETAEDIAIASSVRSPGIMLGGDLNVVIPSEELEPDFLALGITHGKAHADLAKRAQGKSVVHIHNEDISDIDFAFPGTEEQTAISTVVLRLDSLITLHQRKVEPPGTHANMFGVHQHGRPRYPKGRPWKLAQARPACSATITHSGSKCTKTGQFATSP